MFFTKAGMIVAWLAFIWGAFMTFFGLSFAYSGNENHATVPHFGMTIQEMAERGGWALLFGIGLGIVVEISRSLAALREFGPREESSTHGDDGLASQ